MSSAPEFRWNDSFLLGYAPMDDTHREFVEAVEAMRTASDDELAGHIEVFLKHAEEHFEQERALMAATGFPAMDCHVKEHNAVLHSVRQVKELLATKGDAAVCRGLVDELIRWFPAHTDYLDASLAQWTMKKQYGAAPVVLRRGVAHPA